MIPGQPPEYPAVVLDSIRLQNFKTHRDTEIKLGRLTVLVGPNGAGKSSVLQAIELLSQLAQSGSFPLGLLDRHTTIARANEKVGYCAIHIEGRFADGAAWSYASDQELQAARRAKLLGAAELRHQRPSSDHAPDRHLIPAAVAAVMLTPSPERMAAPVNITKASPRLDRDGAGLADVVANMRDNDDDSYQALQIAIRAVVPQIERVRVRREQSGDEAVAHALIFDVAGRKGIPASNMSGGTLLALAILTLLHSPQRPRILLIDDIDHGLHPKAQWDLLKQLRRLLEQFPDLQIVATSHSPDLVDELDPSEVVVLALREDGTSAAKPLTACPREDMLGVLKAGQLWSAIGEDWVKSDDSAEPVP